MKAKNSSTTSTATQLVVLSLVFLCNLKCDAFSTPPRSHYVSVSRLSSHRQQDRNTDNPIVESAEPLLSSSPSIDDDVGTEQAGLLRRRSFATSAFASLSSSIFLCGASPERSYAEEEAATVAADPAAVQVVLTGEVKKLFNEGRAREGQGNIPAATRIYSKVTKIAPKVRTFYYYLLRTYLLLWVPTVILRIFISLIRNIQM